MCRFANGRCPIAVATVKGHHLSGCRITRRGKTGCLTVPVVATQKQRPPGNALIFWLGDLANGEDHHLPGFGTTDQGGTGCLTIPVVVAQEERGLLKAIIRTIARSPVRGGRDILLCWWSLFARSGV